MQRLLLPQVTLCAVTSVNVAATLAAMNSCMAGITFAEALLFTDSDVEALPEQIRRIPIPPITSASAYSDFILHALADYIVSSHCLVVQWDGFVINTDNWEAAFLDYDYIGACWPQFQDGHNVGNGGFSLRSRRLLVACASPDFDASHPEDIAIGRKNRKWLEARGLRFAPPALAQCFSTERSGVIDNSFGFHGVFNMPKALGVQRFWQLYRTLDARDSVWHDFWLILRAIWGGAGGGVRVAVLLRDLLLARLLK